METNKQTNAQNYESHKRSPRDKSSQDETRRQLIFLSLRQFLLTVLLAEPRDELFGWYDANFSLLVGNTVEEVGQAGEQVLLSTGLAAICQDLLPKRPAEVESLQHRVTVTRVPKLK